MSEPLSELECGAQRIALPTFVAACVDAARSADFTARALQERAWVDAIADEPLLAGRDANGALGVVELTFTFHLAPRSWSFLHYAFHALYVWWCRVARLPAPRPLPAWTTCGPQYPGAMRCSVTARRDAAGWRSESQLPS